MDVSRRGRHPSYANQIWKCRDQLRQAEGWTHRVWSSQCMDECPLCASVLCKLLHRECSDCETTYSLGSVQTTMIPFKPFQGVMFFACVAIPQGARFRFRRLKFTHATVLTLTIRNCCRKCRVGACSHSVRKVCVCVCVCLSLDACEVRLPSERHIFGKLFLT